MHTMMMMMTKTGAENADDHVDDATMTMTPVMMIRMVMIMTMKKKMMLTKTEVDVYVDDANDDDDTDDDDCDDDDEAFMKISNCSCYLRVFLANPLVSPWKKIFFINTFS